MSSWSPWERRALFGHRHNLDATTLKLYMARNLADGGRNAKGAAELERLLALSIEREGEEPVRTKRAATHLIRAYEGLGDLSRAAQLREALACELVLVYSYVIITPRR